MGLSVMLTGQDCPYMACSIKAKPGLDLLMGHKPVTLLIQQGGHVGGQEYNFFAIIYIKMVFTSRRREILCS